MSKTIVRPTLSLGNHIYLYRLLRDAIGCGKQTFMTQVEEALTAGDMTAYDLGFESTRELLEELDDCIKLTVFKGGRLYATVIANEAWDAALAKGEDKPKTAKGAKQSYKKKKRGEKDLKAVRPKHVKRPEPETETEVVPEPEPETEIEVAIEVTAEAETEIAATTDPESYPSRKPLRSSTRLPSRQQKKPLANLRRLRSKTAMSLATRPRTISPTSPTIKTLLSRRRSPRRRGLPSRLRSSMTLKTPTPASPPWRPRRSRQSRASRIRALRKSSSTPRPQTHLPSSNPQIPRRCRKRTPNQYSAPNPRPSSR